MVNYIPTESDIQLLKQHNKEIYACITLLNKDGKSVNEFTDVVISGNISIDSDSMIRRTASLTLSAKNINYDFSDLVLFTYYVQLSVGYFSNRLKDIIYYNIGKFVFDKKSTTYDESTDTITFELVDIMGLFEKDREGQLYGAPNTVLYANSMTIREAIIAILEDKDIKNYIIDDVGSKNAYYDETTGLTERYTTIPYDLEFDIGSSTIDELSTLRDLYSGYELFFNTDGTCICQRISTCEDDGVILKSSIVNPLVISENVSSSVYDIKNIVEVWGKDLSCDSYSDEPHYEAASSSVSHDTYSVTLESYGESTYTTDLIVGVKINVANTANSTYLKVINSDGVALPSLKIVDPLNDDADIPANTLLPDMVYVFKYKSTVHGNVWYLLGQYQVHAIAVLTNNVNAVDELTDYYKEKFNCNSVGFLICPESQYCVEKIGEQIKSYNGDNYENIESDSIAKEYALDEVWALSRRTDTIDLEMIYVPWLDVNNKISYIKQKETSEKQYIIKNISSDIMSGTMSVTMMTFYDEYRE